LTITRVDFSIEDNIKDALYWGCELLRARQKATD
jgi:hypothetical protein